MRFNILVSFLRNKYWIFLIIAFGLSLVTACADNSTSEVQLASSTGNGELTIQSGVALPKVDSSERVPSSEINPAEEIDDTSTIIEEVSTDNVESYVTTQGDPVGEPEVESTVDNSLKPDDGNIEPETVPLNLQVGVQVGNLAPEFSLQTPNGELINLSDLRGSPVVVSYWTSWCGPCKNEMQILQKVYQQYQDQGVTVVAVNAIEQDSLGAVSEMTNQLELTYPIVLDHGNRFADDYNALFFPTTYFVGQNGVIMDVALGDSPEDLFIARITRFLENQ